VRHPDYYWDNDDREDEMSEKGPIHLPRVFAAVLFIGLLAAGSAVAWHYSGTGSSKGPQEAFAATDVQQKLQEQDAKIKQLSDQIAQLNATVNAFQASAREAQALVQPAQGPQDPAASAESLDEAIRRLGEVGLKAKK
jgi:TolA-binding protein